MKKLIYILFVFSLLILVGCEEPIDIKLKGMDAQYVVEGSINSDSTIQSIRFYSSKDYTGDNNYQPILNADVKILEFNGVILQNTFSLLFNEATKRYQTTSIVKGKSGFTYKLQIKIGNDEITAEDLMRDSILLDSLKFKEIKPKTKGMNGNNYRYYVIGFLNLPTPKPSSLPYDPNAFSESYIFDCFLNGKFITDTMGLKTFKFRESFLLDSTLTSRNLFIETSGTGNGQQFTSTLKIGDSVKIVGSTINGKYYQYIGELFQSQVSLPFFGPPANPKGNLFLNGKQQGVYGYFATKANCTGLVVFEKKNIIPADTTFNTRF